MRLFIFMFWVTGTVQCHVGCILDGGIIAFVIGWGYKFGLPSGGLHASTVTNSNNN